MNRFLLAFSCFFRLLFGQKLRPDVVAWLPDDAKPKALPEAKPVVKEKIVEKIVEKPAAPKKSDAVAQRAPPAAGASPAAGTPQVAPVFPG